MIAVVTCLFGIRTVVADEPAPFAVLTVASVDRMLADVERILPAAHDRLAPVIEQLEGIDRTVSVGLLIFYNSENSDAPDFVASIPTIDVQKLRDALVSFPFVSLKPDQGHRWTLEIPTKKFIARVSDGRLDIASREEYLSRSAPWHQLLLEVAGDADVAIRLNFGAFPNELRGQARTKFDADLERDAIRKPDEPELDHRIRLAVRDVVRDAGHRVIAGSGQVDLKLKLESGLHLWGKWQAIPGSDLAGDFSGLAREVARWRSAGENPALRTRIAVALPGWFADGLARVVAEIQNKTEREMGDTVDAAGRASALGIFESITTTLATRHLDGGFAFVPTPDQHLAFIADISIEKSERAAETLAVVLPHIEQSGEVRSVERDVLPGQPLTMHRIVRKEPRQREERLYGPQPSLYVGTTAGEFLFAAGGAATEGILAASRAQTAQSPPLLSIEVVLREWLELAARERPNFPKLERVREIFTDSQRGQAQFQIRSADGALNWTIDADEGYVKLLGLPFASQ